MKEVYEFLQKCKTFYVATTDGDKPKVRPFGVCMIFEDKLYFSSSSAKPFWTQIVNNPNIEICAYDGNTDWLRISAKIVADSRSEVKAQMLKENPHLGPIYANADYPVGLFYLSNAHATFEDLAGKKDVRTF